MKVGKPIASAAVALAVLSSAGCGPGGGGASGDATPQPDPSATPSPDPSATPAADPTPPTTPFPHPTPIAEPLALLRRLPHGGWSEGLDIHGGELWHAYPGAIEVFDPVSGDLLRTYDPPSGYSESLAWRDGELWNVSYDDAFVYAGTPSADGTSFSWRVAGTGPDEHAWGITHDSSSVIVTGNGRETLYFLDPNTVELQHTVTTPVDDLEDIAFDRGAIWGSSYSEYPGQFFRIDPETGAIVDVHALPEGEGCTIVDGIAVGNGELYVTGKDCSWIYVYRLP